MDFREWFDSAGGLEWRLEEGSERPLVGEKTRLGLRKVRRAAFRVRGVGKVRRRVAGQAHPCSLLPPRSEHKVINLHKLGREFAISRCKYVNRIFSLMPFHPAIPGVPRHVLTS